MPQDPPGWLTIVDLVGQPSTWTLRKVILEGLGQCPEDPKPEFVSVRANNIAAVTLQENNYIALVDLVPLSDNKGTEPEGIEIARYLNHNFLFVGMERADAVAVYRIDGNESRPRFVQVLGTGERPEARVG